MTREPSSPVCYAGTAADLYMGCAGRDELVEALNELLEAERAGARVTLHAAGAGAATAALLEAVHRDESRWCAMLAEEVRLLGAEPSQRCGDFYDKAMAITDLPDRLLFLNKGQSWVVRKLAALMPRVRDDALHAKLRAMHDSHVANIERTTQHHSAMQQ